jgi:hypothetical protein
VIVTKYERTAMLPKIVDWQTTTTAVKPRQHISTARGNKFFRAGSGLFAPPPLFELGEED